MFDNNRLLELFSYEYMFNYHIISGQVTCQTNVALNATVTLSSTYTSGNRNIPNGDAYKAVDGDNNQDWYVGGCACTKKQKNPWMTVNFGDVYSIERVVIYNREDCCRK